MNNTECKRVFQDMTIATIILAYCTFQAKNIYIAWQFDVFAKYAWIAFLIWIMPVLCHWLSCFLKKEPIKFDPYCLSLAMLFSLIGNLGSLNILTHIGLALAIAGLLPCELKKPLWFLGFISWIPATGWLLVTRLGLPFNPITRIGLSIMFTIFNRPWNYFKAQLFEPQTPPSLASLSSQSRKQPSSHA